MKKILLIIVLLISKNICYSQDCLEQQKVLEKIIEENSISTFFKDKTNIYVENSLCKDSTEFSLDDKKIIFNNKITDKSLKILEYESTDRIIFIEIALFSNKVIYSAFFKKKEGDIFLINKWTTFIRSRD